MDIKFEASCIKKQQNVGKQDEVIVTIDKDKTLDFLNAVMDDELVKSFIECPKTKAWLAENIGVKGLLTTYNKEEVLSSVGWDYVREFFLDHMDTNQILNHIGWENVKEHFSDKIAVESSQNDINTVGKSILETLNESEGQNQ